MSNNRKIAPPGLYVSANLGTGFGLYLFAIGHGNVVLLGFALAAVGIGIRLLYLLDGFNPREALSWVGVVSLIGYGAALYLADGSSNALAVWGLGLSTLTYTLELLLLKPTALNPWVQLGMFGFSSLYAVYSEKNLWFAVYALGFAFWMIMLLWHKNNQPEGVDARQLCDASIAKHSR